MEKSAAGKKNINRMAVLVGINYPNTENQLRGCYNDVVLMRTVLVDRFGFDPDNIELLTDDPDDGCCSDHNDGGGGGGSFPSSSSSTSMMMMMPTGEHIKRALDDMVDRAEEGDVLFFHYSGHGTVIPSPEDPASEPEEAIVPCDFNLITETDIRELVTRLPPGASLTILTDSCHSGGLIDKEDEQVGPNSTPPPPPPSSKIVTIVLPSLLRKTIPLDSILNKLKHLTRMDSGNIGDHLNERFKKQASLSFKRREKQLVTEEGSGGGGDDRFDCDSRVPYSVILLSGCQASEESADVKVKGGGGGGGDGKSYGAFTLAVEMALKKSSSAVGGSTSVSNRKVVMMARKVLEEMGIKQHPCLYCSDENADAPFLWQLPPDCKNIEA